ncbi:MAG: hypothetical protein ABIY35_09395 [Chitinophagaceae bacterium]
MKKKYSLFYLFLFTTITSSSCHTKTSKEQVPANNKNDTLVYYPVNQYLRSQLSMLENSPVQPFKILITDSGKDSSSITKEEVKNFAQLFLNDSITAFGMKEKYTENIFQDQTTASYTFSYTAKDTLLPVQRVLVLLDTATQQVKNIIYSISRSYTDSTITEMLWWKNDKGFTILHSATLTDGTEQKRQLQIGWIE